MVNHHHVKELIGNQVKILNRPAAVSSVFIFVVIPLPWLCLEAYLKGGKVTRIVNESEDLPVHREKCLTLSRNRA